MPATLHRLMPAALGCVLVALVGGCQLGAFERNMSKELEAKKLESPPVRTPVASTHDAAKTPAKPKPAPPAVAAADDATVASVMEEARKISAANPDAGAMLLDELSRAEPKLWPLTLQQFRSRQALHEQLLKRPKTATNSADAKIEEVVTEDPVTTDRPSEEVGRLADPRRVGTDAAVDETFATATPANMPAPLDAATLSALAAESARPAAFAADAAARPLSETKVATQTNDGVVQAGVVQANVAEAGQVERALFDADDVAQTAPPKSLDWREHLQLAVDDLNERLADGPRSTAEVHQVVSLRMLQLMAGETESALQPIPNVSTQEQDYWSSQIFTLATFLDHHRQPDDERRAAASVIHLDEAVGHLRELGSLSVRNLAFCKNVFGYGAYEPINTPLFSPGQQLTLYLEVENYHSESTAKGYSTKLGANYEIVTDAGERVAGGEFPNIEDNCQSRRRDFHVQYGLALPKTA
jgi:hypothetical protein